MSELSIFVMINNKQFAVDATGKDDIAEALRQAGQFVSEEVHRSIQKQLAPKRRKKGLTQRRKGAERNP